MQKNISAINLQVLTSYPQKGGIHGKGTVGIASYSKNTLIHLLEVAEFNKINLHISVLAEILPGEKKAIYREDGIEVKRIWKKNNFFSYIYILQEILRQKRDIPLIIEFEVSMFGPPRVLIPFPIFLFILKLFSKKIILIPHQFIFNINDLSGHIGITYQSITSKILNILIKSFYYLVFNLADKIIVFEEIFRRKIKSYINDQKVIVIPHGVEKNRSKLDKTTARNLLGIKNEFVFLFFGFLGWYKGTDWIVDFFSEFKPHLKYKNIKLIIAGGKNPNHLDKKFYLDYCSEIQKKASNSHNKITVTGFVKESEIPKYFIASDVVIFPYRTFMSSSGPLSLAFTYGRPIFLSESLKGYLETADFGSALKFSGLSEKDIFFSLEKNNLSKNIESLNDSLLSKMKSFSEIMLKKRNFINIAQTYLTNIC